MSKKGLWWCYDFEWQDVLDPISQMKLLVHGLMHYVLPLSVSLIGSLSCCTLGPAPETKELRQTDIFMRVALSNCEQKQQKATWHWYSTARLGARTAQHIHCSRWRSVQTSAYVLYSYVRTVVYVWFFELFPRELPLRALAYFLLVAQKATDIELGKSNPKALETPVFYHEDLTLAETTEK